MGKLPHKLCYLPAKIPKVWRDLLLLIPDYDSVVTAEDAWFDAEAAQFAIDFIQECLRHVEGFVAGKPFILQPWQKSIIINLFGWNRHDAAGNTVRRYREMLLYVARKNGKTPLVAAIALLVFFTDSEHGQQGSIAATDKKQAAKLFRHCRGMIEREPALKSRCKLFGGTSLAGQAQAIVREEDDSYLEIISADSSGKHGGNPHLVIIDELHEQKSPELVETLESSFVSANRIQPLFICITTADYDRPSICNRKYERASKIAEGSMAIRRGVPADQVITDAQFLPVIYEVPRDADWRDESLWHKANPNLGVSVDLHALRVKCKRAQEVPAEENGFRRLHLNQKTSTADRLIPLWQWDACSEVIDLAALAGRECHAALDIGAMSDFTAMVLLFPHDDAEEIEIPADPAPPAAAVSADVANAETADVEKPPAVRTIIRRSYTMLSSFWLPEEPIKRDNRMEKIIDGWRKECLIKTTPGNSVDYDMVLEDILLLLDPYQLVDFAFDRGFQGGQMGTNLMKTFGDKVISFPQGILSMNAPFREFLELLAVKRLHHDGNPVMRWMASNVVAERRGGLMKPSKDKSSEKIDGITAAVMAIGRALFAVANAPRSVYDSRGVVQL